MPTEPRRLHKRPGMHAWPELAGRRDAEIRRLRDSGVRVKDIARRFGIDPATVWRVMQKPRPEAPDGDT